MKLHLRQGEIPPHLRKFFKRASAPYKAKDLVNIPHLVGEALRADGWYLRQMIVWSKPNPMPESTQDRCTTAHEYVLLLSRNPRYFYDAEAVKEPSTDRPSGNQTRRFGDDYGRPGNHRGASVPWEPDGSGRNRRSVWEIPTQPTPEAHFATYPERLVEPCILAGTSERGVCRQCGAPWRRVTKKVLTLSGKSAARGASRAAEDRRDRWGDAHGSWSVETIDWQPTCKHPGDPDEYEIIQTPTGKAGGDDPTLQTGRAGMNRPRGANEGTRPITRYEQRRYAAQIRGSPARALRESEAGSAFAHYIRTDKSGARPVPPDLLDRWISNGWLVRVDPPMAVSTDPIPATVLDPFLGSGTTARVAERLGRNWIGVELSESYAAIARRRTAQAGLMQWAAAAGGAE